MTKKKKQEGTWQITFLGLLSLLVNEACSKSTDSNVMSKEIHDGIELYLRRHYSDGVDCPAIILTKDGFKFGSVVKGD